MKSGVTLKCRTAFFGIIHLLVIIYCYMVELIMW